MVVRFQRVCECITVSTEMLLAALTLRLLSSGKRCTAGE